jgi:hypothetical protein
MSLEKLTQNIKILFVITAFCAACFTAAPDAGAQEIEARIRILSAAPGKARLRVEGRILNPEFFKSLKDWSFLRSYADADALASRIENLKLYAEGGERLEVKKLIDGEFRTEEAAHSFEYEIKTDAPARLTSAAHVS